MEPLFLPKTVSLYQRGGYNKHQIQSDIFSGLIVGILALPLAIAFAIASGVSPEKGLITAIIAGFFISLLGGSRVQIGGPTGAFVVIVVGIVNEYGIQGLILSTILAGFILILFGVLRLGTLIKYIPVPLVTGFTSGIAVVIFTSQINDFLGLGIRKLPSDFISKWGLYLENISAANIYAVLIAAFTILINIYSKRYIKKIPGAFISIVLMTSAVFLFNIPVQTINSVYGDIPHTFRFEDLSAISVGNIAGYIRPALTIAMLGAIESLLSAVVSDGMISSTHRSNTELIAQGIANVASGFFGGIPATGAIARTATNVRNGGRTPFAGIVHALTLLLIMIFFGRYAGMIPLSCLAGILIVVAYNIEI
jgi:SulP family sulfate permease